MDKEQEENTTENTTTKQQDEQNETDVINIDLCSIEIPEWESEEEENDKMQYADLTKEDRRVVQVVTPRKIMMKKKNV